MSTATNTPTRSGGQHDPVRLAPGQHSVSPESAPAAPSRTPWGGRDSHPAGSRWASSRFWPPGWLVRPLDSSIPAYCLLHDGGLHWNRADPKRTAPGEPARLPPARSSRTRHLLGRSGSGKSTLLRALAGLDQDIEGQVHVPAKRATEALDEVGLADEPFGALDALTKVKMHGPRRRPRILKPAV